jgi:hypothetical protein
MVLSKQIYFNTQHAACFVLVSCLAYTSPLMMDATFSSETSVNFYRTTLHYILEDGNIHNHRCENLISYLHSVS